MNDNGQTVIDEKFLDSGDLFGIKYSNGYVFFRVDMWEELQYKPYNVGSVAPQSNSGFSRLEDNNGDDILHISKEDEQILHAAIGMAPAHSRRFTNYPESENRLRTFPNLTVPSARSGSDYGFIDGDVSPYENPTDAAELYIPPDVHLDFDFYNPKQDRSIQPRLNIRAREYFVTPIDPERNKDEVRRIVSPGSPMPVAPAGTPSNQFRVSSNQWNVDTISEREIQQLLGRN